MTESNCSTIFSKLPFVSWIRLINLERNEAYTNFMNSWIRLIQLQRDLSIWTNKAYSQFSKIFLNCSSMFVNKAYFCLQKAVYMNEWNLFQQICKRLLRVNEQSLCSWIRLLHSQKELLYTMNVPLSSFSPYEWMRLIHLF